MKKNAKFVAIYGLLILVGGLVGYQTANSLASLIASSIIALLLSICALFIMKGKEWAYNLATLLTFFLLLFFAYRFSLGFKIAPGGIMTLISGIFLTYLIVERKKRLS